MKSERVIELKEVECIECGKKIKLYDLNDKRCYDCSTKMTKHAEVW